MKTAEKKKAGLIKWVASSFLWLLSPSWAASLWEDWTQKKEADPYPPPPKKEK